MKKMISMFLCALLLLSGCGKAEEKVKVESAKYTSKEVQQIFKENGYEIDAHDGFIFFNNDAYSGMLSKSDKFISLIFNLYDDQAYFVRLAGDKIENVAYTGNGSECYYNLTSQKFDESSDSDCGNLAIENSKKTKEVFEKELSNLGLNQSDLVIFMKDFENLYELYK